MKVGENKSLHFPVVVTSFEILMIDRPHLERHLWQVSKVEISRVEKGKRRKEKRREGRKEERKEGRKKGRGEKNEKNSVVEFKERDGMKLKEKVKYSGYLKINFRLIIYFIHSLTL